MAPVSSLTTSSSKRLASFLIPWVFQIWICLISMVLWMHEFGNPQGKTNMGDFKSMDSQILAPNPSPQMAPSIFEAKSRACSFGSIFNLGLFGFHHFSSFAVCLR